MGAANELKFESPSFIKRLKGMMGVDFYRLFHTPMLYIFLAIAALIPAMILGTSGSNEGAAPLYTNTWNIIAANTPIYAVSDMCEYANMNMVFIFGGIMVSIFIGHDYKSGYVKQLFTTHAKKQDYMISKTISCAFAMTCMCITYTIGGAVAGLLAGTSFEVNAVSLVLAIVSIPLGVKEVILRIGYHLCGEQNSCLTLSNLGEISFPSEIEPYIERAGFLLSPRRNAPYNCGVASCKGKLYINFSRRCEKAELEPIFFRRLAALGCSGMFEEDG